MPKSFNENALRPVWPGFTLTVNVRKLKDPIVLALAGERRRDRLLTGPE